MKVKVRSIDDHTLYRTTELDFAGSRLQTPLKAIDRGKMAVDHPLPEEARGINEVYRQLKTDSLADLMTEDRALRKFVRRPQRSVDKAANLGEVSVLFLELDAPQLEDQELEFVADISYSMTDVVTVPLVDGIHRAVDRIDHPLFERYLEMATGFVEQVEVLNHKPLMGTIPPLPWALNERLCHAYLDLGIRAFCVDFAGRSPSAAEAANLRPFLRRLREEGLQEEVVLYAINASTGKSSKSHPPGVAPAKDILSYGFSFDILGLKHIGLRGPKEMFDKMKAQGPKVRLFHKDDYAYRAAPMRNAADVYPSDTHVPLADLTDERRRSIAQSVLNMEQQAIEAMELRQRINEDLLADHLDSKAILDRSDRRRFTKAKQAMTTQASLTDWG